MFRIFRNSFCSEWLKTRRSTASWLVIAGALLIPAILLGARLYEFEKIATDNQGTTIWITLYNRGWRYLGSLLLPMGVMLLSSLIAQLEFRNNTWKQVHVLPQPLLVTFTSKFSVVMVFLLSGFLLFNAGLYLAGVLPSLLPGIPYPSAEFPWFIYVRGSARFLLSCLPIVALQFLLSLQFRNFLVPIGAGFGLYVASMIGLNWKHGYILPYVYPTYETAGMRIIKPLGTDMLVLALSYFVVILLLAYRLYTSKKDKA